MKKIKDLIREYLQESIQTKKGMKKRIYQLEEQVREARANEKYAIEQKDKYKQTNKKLRKKLIEKKEK